MRHTLLIQFIQLFATMRSLHPRRLVLITLASGLLLSGVFSISTTHPALAAAKDTPETQASDFAYYMAFRRCMAAGWFKNSVIQARQGSMSQKNAIDFEWFNARKGTDVNGQNIGAFQDPRGASGDGSQNCGDSEGTTWITKAVNQWGYTDGPRFLCKLGFTRSATPNECANLTGGSEDWVRNDFLESSSDSEARTNTVIDFWKNTLGYSGSGVSSIEASGGLYALYLANFKSQCRISATTSGSGTYTIQEWDPVKKDWVQKKYTAISTDRGTGYSVTIYDGAQMSCGDLAKNLSDKSSAALMGYRTFYIKSSVPPPDIEENGGEQDEDDSAEGVSTCTIEGIGWIVCPVVNFMAGIADGAFAFLADSFLRTDPNLLKTDGPVYDAWSAVRNLANVVFVIAFLFIIFSQLTGLGIANYGVKKMLPRLVVAAILVNVSYILSQLAVDISNILGYSIKDTFAGIAASAGVDNIEQGENFLGDGEGFQGVAGGILAAVGLGLLGYSLLGTLIPVLLAAVVGLVMILFILIARQVLIILLIILSPLAFVAFLLPNTEGLFKQWRKIFVSMLLLFPMVAIVFGASALTSDIISASIAEGSSADETNNWFAQIIAAAVMVLPLFVVPILLKGSLNAIPALGNFANKLSSKASAGAGNAYKKSDFAAFRGQKKAEARAQVRSGQYGGKNPLSRARAAANRRMNSKDSLFNKATGGFGERRGKSAMKLENKEILEKAESLAGRTEDNGLPLDAMAHYNKTAEDYGNEYNTASPSRKKELRVDLAAAQTYLSKTGGATASDHIQRTTAALRQKLGGTPASTTSGVSPVSTSDGSDPLNRARAASGTSIPTGTASTPSIAVPPSTTVSGSFGSTNTFGGAGASIPHVDENPPTEGIPVRYEPNKADLAEQKAREDIENSPSVLGQDSEAYIKAAYDQALKEMPPWARPTEDHQARKTAHLNAMKEAKERQNISEVRKKQGEDGATFAVGSSGDVTKL